MTTLSTSSTDRRTRRSDRLMKMLAWGGAAQAALILLPLLDLWIFRAVEQHVHAAYPAWGADAVHADTVAIDAAMIAVGCLGVIGWLVALVAARRGTRPRETVTALFAIGMAVLACVAGLGGGAYDQIVPLWLGATTLAISALAGIAAVVVAWHRRT